MATTNDLKNGMTLNLDGNLMNVVEFQHVKPGKGGAFVRTKLKNVRTGRTLDKTFRADEPVEVAILEKREMQYLYRDETGFVFMDTQTYDQAVVDADAVGGAASWLTDGATPYVTFYEGTAIGVELPAAVELQVTETEPGIKGDRVSGGDQAGHGRDRGRGPGAAVRGDRRPHQGRHPLRGVPDPGAVSDPLAGGRARHPLGRPPPGAPSTSCSRPTCWTGPWPRCWPATATTARPARSTPTPSSWSTGSPACFPELDARIADAAEHWTIDRMPLVDRNLLRLAAYELTARPEVPTAVVLDEAIELAKLLSTADSGRFVNGVLAHIAAEVRGAG